MTDHADLLRAIAANPRDDTPRLAYADWLEEHDRPDHARFIRTEVDIYRRPEWDGDRIRYEHAARTHPGWAASRPWLRDLLTRPGGGLDWAGAPPVRRGFPWKLGVSVINSAQDERLAALAAAHPVEHVVFSAAPPDLRRLARSPWLPGVRGLTFSRCGSVGRHLAGFLNDPRAAGLDELAFDFSPLTVAGVAEVFRSGVMPNLARLSFDGLRGNVGRAILDGLRGAAAPRLRTLALEMTLPGLEGTAQLVAGGLPAGVVSLSLAMNSLNADRTAALAAVPVFANLRILNLYANHIGNAGAAALASSPHLGELRVLRLGHAMVGDDGIRAILASPLADRLVLLDLTGNPASAEMKHAVKDALGERVRV